MGLALSLPAFCARKVTEPGITPIQAELIADLNARLLKVGAPVYARVTIPWTGTGCVLHKGAVLEAHVVSVAPYNKSTKLSELDLSFTQAQCAAPKMVALDLVLAAMAAPPHDSDLGMLSDALPVPAADLLGGNGYQAMAMAQMTANVDFKLGVDSSVYDVPAFPHMHVGDVSGIRGLKLNIGSGPENSTVLASKGHDVALEKHTLLMLIPAQGTYPRPVSESEKVQPISVASPGAPLSAMAGASEPVPAALVAGASNVEPPDDIDVCDPLRCNVALAPAEEIDARKPQVSFSTRQLGYASRPQEEFKEFDRDEALAWLGAGQLLVAFNRHGLITRHSLGPSGSTERIIRAALIDTNARRITRTVDWELPDNGEYVWPLSGNRVLVHVGSELRVYGSGLKISQRMVLDGPLAFVRVTPNGNFIVVGQVHERHSPELHAQLREVLQREPEEDVGVTVLNRNFETIARSDARSYLVPPTLLNEGQARLLALRNRRYRVTLQTWDSRSLVLVSFSSSCTPQLSSMAPNLLFLASCNLHNDLLEYRVLDSSGKLTLKGISEADDLLHTAKGIANPGSFVVKTIRSGQVSRGDPFQAASLDSEELEVYRAADGKRLFGLRVGLPTSGLDGYALADDGSQLAILTRDELSIYAVAQK